MPNSPKNSNYKQIIGDFFGSLVFLIHLLATCMRQRLTYLTLVILIGLGGCAPWDKKAANPTRNIFPPTRIASDAVGLELGIAQLDSDQADTFEAFWRQLDQQALPLALRKQLDQNGLRAAIMSTPPTQLHELFQDQPIHVDQLNRLEQQLLAKGLLRKRKRMIAHERISNREGQVHPVSVSEMHPQISWIVFDEDRQMVGSGENARGIFTITTYPLGDGSVRVVFEPEIHHGKTRQRIGVAERSFLLQEGQTVNRIEALKFEVVLRPGESFAIAPTSDLEGLGHLFFGAAKTQETQIENRAALTHRMMLVRVVQTQMDDLFSDSSLVEKLSTTPRH
ncbi:MAG: hypothetical protein ACI87E_003827 [Mariniblastus sp.]